MSMTNKPRIADIDEPIHCPFRVEYFKNLDNTSTYGDDIIELCCNPKYLRTVGTYPKCDPIEDDSGKFVGFPSYCPLEVKKTENVIGIVPGRR